MAADARLIHAIRGPVTLITLGVLFTLDHFTPYHFDQTWPVLLIVFGLLSLLRRSLGGPRPVPPPNVPPGAPPWATPPAGTWPPPPPSGGYATGGYRGSNYGAPPAGSGPGPGSPGGPQ